MLQRLPQREMQRGNRRARERESDSARSTPGQARAADGGGRAAALHVARERNAPANGIWLP